MNRMNAFPEARRLGLVAMIVLLAAVNVFAQNPLTPEGRFLADPAVRMGADGTLYAIGSVDVEADGYCSTRYAVLASRDLGLTWTWHPDVFSSAGQGPGGVDGQIDGVPYNDRILFAPDWLPGPDGWTLYYCQPDRVNAEGVATASGPLGPFTGGEPLPTLGYAEIDPAVYRDDDGSVYYLWGQFSVKMARLQPDGRSLDSATLVKDLLTEREHGFHEGVSMAKRNGLYYLVYAYMGRADRPTGLAWAWSRQPFGPYAFGGVLIDNDGCDPATWNNHGCIAPLDAEGEQWAVFYHRATQSSQSMRKACAEPIAFDAEGRVAEVEMTSQGLGPALSAHRRIEARLACLLHGQGRVGPLPHASESEASLAPDSMSGEGLIGFGHRDRAAFKYLDFGQGVDSVRLRVLAAESPATLLLRLDQPWGPVIARVELPASSQWQSVQAAVSGAVAKGALSTAGAASAPEKVAQDRPGPSPENQAHALWVQVVVPNDSDATLALDWLEFW